MHLKSFNIQLILVLSISLLMASCTKSISGSGELVTKSYDVSSFDFIEFNAVGDVSIKQGSVQTVKLTTNPNLFNAITINSNNQILQLDVAENTNIKNYDMMHFEITIPKVKGAELNGSGNLFFMDSISGESFRTDLNGSGNIIVNNVNNTLLVSTLDGSGDVTYKQINTKDLHVAIEGSGNVSMVGIATDQVVTLNGSGNVLNYNLLTKTSIVKLEGSGNCQVSASTFLDIVLSGSGNIYYKGNPTLKTSITGSGEIIKTVW